MNPLFKALGGGAMPSMPGPLGNFQQMVHFASALPARGASVACPPPRDGGG